MNKYQRIAARIIDNICDVVNIQHPELNLKQEMKSNTVTYFALESQVAEQIKKFWFDQNMNK